MYDTVDRVVAARRDIVRTGLRSRPGLDRRISVINDRAITIRAIRIWVYRVSRSVRSESGTRGPMPAADVGTVYRNAIPVVDPARGRPFGHRPMGHFSRYCGHCGRGGLRRLRTPLCLSLSLRKRWCVPDGGKEAKGEQHRREQRLEEERPSVAPHEQ